jgi:hypothetical protein
MAMGHSEHDPAVKERQPWNVGRMVGAKRALKPQQVWAIRFWLDRERRLRGAAPIHDRAEPRLPDAPPPEPGLCPSGPLSYWSSGLVDGSLSQTGMGTTAALLAAIPCRLK